MPLSSARRPDDDAVQALRRDAHPFTGEEGDLDPLLQLVGDARVVLLGEATHGTHEFYAERVRITRALVQHKGFRAVAVEGDWPDAWRVNRWIRGDDRDPSAADALSGFRRFPTWMWRNTDVVDLAEALRRLNASREPHEQVGFYGLDLYSLHTSMEAVLRHLDRSDPDAARRARERYACFDRFGTDSQRYGMLTAFGAATPCEEQALQVLVDLRRAAAATRGARGHQDREAAFDAEQNARLVKDAEAYYRTMVRGDASSWNLRDRHMAATLRAIVEHLDETAHAAGDPNPGKVVVWAHNSHVGDARATEMGEVHGELTLGQLAREAAGDDAVLVGFTTSHGTVTAARDWDAPSGHRQVRPARHDSVEHLLHRTGIERFFLRLRGDGEAARMLREPLLERAIGVVYRPDTERQSHYFHARVSSQFDAVVHVDRTQAVVPLEPWVEHDEGLETAGPHGTDLPETWPTGF